MALTTPDSDQRAFRNTGFGLRLVVLCILSVAIMVLDHNNEHLKTVRLVLSAAAHPIRLIIDAPFSLGHWLGDSAASRSELMEENRQLQAQNFMQSARLQRHVALEAENARLRALLDSTAKIGGRVLIAEIMSVDMNPFPVCQFRLIACSTSTISGLFHLEDRQMQLNSLDFPHRERHTIHLAVLHSLFRF